MIAQIVIEGYDVKGQRSSPYFLKSDLVRFHPTFPIGHYAFKPLATEINNFKELRSFLLDCKYVSDEKQFGEDDYWILPHEFEKLKKGDCEDFALWAWRQILNMGYPARFVVGLSS